MIKNINRLIVSFLSLVNTPLTPFFERLVNDSASSS
jgi:hypothetical protein